ncbi:MAG: hypothetical protein KGI67_13080 [Pseudomonadota bacterium]|nr:hypothetical protein [Pseudomonadota bacterium]
MIALAGLAMAPALAQTAASVAGPSVRIEDLHGPAAPSVIARPPATDWQTMDHGGAARLAILLTGPDQGSWLGLVEGLRALGVPVTVTRDWHEAVHHRMVVIYPEVSGRHFDAEAFAALRNIPLNGGTLLAFNVMGGVLSAAFGVREVQPARNRFAFRFEGSGRPPREAEIPLGTAAQAEPGLWTFAYVAAGASVLARFDDGMPALLDNPEGGGHAYLMGVDAGDLLLRGHNNRQQGITRAYVNQYEPAADVLLHWIKDRYREAEPLAVTLATAPDGKALPVMITHDLDYLASLRNAQDYLAFEREAGIRATYFAQTKYVRDWEDKSFLDAEGVELIRALALGGMEVGSHTVAHSRVFNRMDAGTGEERFPAYHPVVADHHVCRGCSVFGEARISRFLLEQLTGTAPLSFRSGHLLNPPMLPEILVASGYRFGSDSTANDLLSHLPVHAHFGRGSSTELPFYEFPVTIEDEESPPLGERVGPALAVAEDVIRDEGIFVVLIHPNVVGHKLRFERELVRALRDRAWFGSIADFGEWWTARDRLEFDVVPGTDADPQPHLHITAPLPIEGLTLQLPPGVHLAPGGVVRRSVDRTAVLGALAGEIDIPLGLDAPQR